jgi:hypothetical protein
MLDDILESEKQVNLPLLKVDSAISCLRPEKVISEVKCFLLLLLFICDINNHESDFFFKHFVID